MRLSDEGLDAFAKYCEGNARAMSVIAELRELRALLAAELPQRFSVFWNDDKVDQLRIGLSLRGESFVLEPDSALAIGAALIRAYRAALEARGGKR